MKDLGNRNRVNGKGLISFFFIGKNGLILVRIMDSNESFGSLDYIVKEIHMRKFYRGCVEKDGNG